jgi:hypothetical protein
MPSTAGSLFVSLKPIRSRHAISQNRRPPNHRPSRLRWSAQNAKQCSLIGLFVFALVLSSAPIAKAQNVTPRITEAVENEKRVTLRGNTYPLARPEHDRGAAPDSLPMERMLLVLTRSPEQEVALTTLLDEQQDRSSPNFHRWLTPEQFGQQFGPADADIQAVTGWLMSQGFRVNNVAKGRTVIEFSGDAGLVRNGFHTQIHKYVVNGEEHWANASDPQIPAGLAPVVGGIDSLNNFPRRPMHHVVGVFSRTKATGELTPLVPLFTFPSPAGCGLSPTTASQWVPMTSQPSTTFSRSGMRELMVRGKR